MRITFIMDPVFSHLKQFSYSNSKMISSFNFFLNNKIALPNLNNVFKPSVKEVTVKYLALQDSIRKTSEMKII